MALPTTEITPIHLLIILPGLDDGGLAGRIFAEVDAVLRQGLVAAQARVNLMLARGLGVLVDVIPIHEASLVMVSLLYIGYIIMCKCFIEQPFALCKKKRGLIAAIIFPRTSRGWLQSALPPASV